ncbi:MAG: hypothetical protein ACTSQO_05685 [Candidatus Helarchaeota archaeon]
MTKLSSVSVNKYYFTAIDVLELVRLPTTGESIGPSVNRAPAIPGFEIIFI